MVVKKIISETEFIVYHEELRTSLILRQVAYDEELTRWKAIPPHSNIASCFDYFIHKDGDKVYKFSLQEVTNAGNMY